MSSSVTVRVPATSANLGPGFDALGLALQLYNEVTLEVAERDSTVAIGEGAEDLKGVATTIAHTSAREVFGALRLGQPNFQLKLDNSIPLARGLGSSSAAIVGGLLAANEWCRLDRGRSLQLADLLRLANQIEGHPDNVAPALMGGCVSALVDDAGSAHAVKLPLPKTPKFLVYIPGEALETKKARAVLPDSYSKADAIFNLSRSAYLMAALASGDWTGLPEALRDRIHQEQRAPIIPAFKPLAEVAGNFGALGTTISGAGPTILFWLKDQETASTVEEALTDYIADQVWTGRLLALEMDDRGAQVITGG